MARGNIYWVETYMKSLNKWIELSGTKENKSFCEGYLFAMSSLYPSSPYRIMIRKSLGSQAEVFREFKGNSRVSVN